MGELVCETLGDWFAAGTHDRTTRWPMMLLIHDSRRESQEESGRRLPEASMGLVAESLGHREFAKLSAKPDQKIPASSFAGAAEASQIDLFYAQACAASIYLFAAEEGRHRAKLMEYVGAYYRGESPKIPDYFGMSPAELGKKAQAYARRSRAD